MGGSRRLAEPIASALRQNGGRCFENGADSPVRVEPVRARRGTASSIYDVDLISDGRRRSLTVKVADGTGAGGSPAVDAPRIGRWCDAGTILRYEHQTLGAIHEHFAARRDPRFGAVRVYDLFPGGGAIAMQRLTLPTLRSLLLRGAWAPGAPIQEGLLEAFRNAGAWLREFHGFPPLEHTTPRRTRRSQFIDSLDEFARYLVEAGEDRAALQGVVSGAREAARRLLPEELPAGMGHGDYAPRNVLVGRGARIVVIDTPGRWWFPIYQDIGYFLTGLKTLGPRVVSGGLLVSRAKLARLETAFLEGYFAGEAVPRAAIGLFEIQTLLSRWVSAVHHARHARGARRIAKLLVRALKGAFCNRCLGAALADASRSAAVRRGVEVREAR